MNRCRVLVLTLVLAVVGCTEHPEPTAPGVGALSNIAVTPTEPDCLIEAGAFDAPLTTTTGEIFFGAGAHDGDVEDADWDHHDPDWPHHPEGFLMQSFDRATSVVCLNIGIGLEAFIQGFAAVNGQLGYVYEVVVIDEGPAPEELLLESTSGGASASFSEPRWASVPAELPVTSGTAGPGLVWISFDDTKCFYSANASGNAYVFSRCEEPDLTPGIFRLVSSLEMQVAGPDRTAIVVSANITVAASGGSLFGDPYTIGVWNEATGDLVYHFSGNVADGDIVITPLNQ